MQQSAKVKGTVSLSRMYRVCCVLRDRAAVWASRRLFLFKMRHPSWILFADSASVLRCATKFNLYSVGYLIRYTCLEDGTYCDGALFRYRQRELHGPRTCHLSAFPFCTIPRVRILYNSSTLYHSISYKILDSSPGSPTCNKAIQALSRRNRQGR